MNHEADQPDRATERWDEDDYRKLAAGLRSGQTEVQLAESLGRTRNAVRSRARMLLRPLGHGKGTLDELRDLVADDPAFDLLALARDAHHADGTKLWSAADDERLRTAVEAGEPSLTTLAAELGVPEGQIVSRMTRVQIVSSTLAAVERLGADPRGSVAARAAIARDKSTAMLWVLSVVNRAREHVHVSLNPTPEDAEQALAALQPAAGDEIDHREKWYWVIATRLVGEGSVREVRSGAFSPRATT